MILFTQSEMILFNIYKGIESDKYSLYIKKKKQLIYKK